MDLALSKPTGSDGEQAALFAQFRSSGYTGLQLKSHQYERYVTDPAAFRARWGDDPGLCSALITMDTLDHEAVERLRALFTFGAAVGAERVVLCHNARRDGLSDKAIAGFGRSLSGLGAEAAERGLRLSLHHHYGQPVMHRRDFDTFFAAVEPGTLGLTLDTGHLARCGIGDMGGIVRDFHPFLDNVHLKDEADGAFRLVGDGRVDFNGLVRALHDVEYRGVLCVDEESTAPLEIALGESKPRAEALFRSAVGDSV
jgi:sugar phosphate isomerase/epimerase